MKRGNLNWRIRGEVMARSYLPSDHAFVCNWCCSRLSAGEVVIDHMVPVARGGGGDIDNLTVSCRRCNEIKRDHPPEYAEELINRVLEARYE